ncbi:MAG: dethiobiotin synthase [Sphingobium sp. 66-54]|nr:MAG: dethiobiotin synthase [Sphingobium sp. 66-54]
MSGVLIVSGTDTDIGKTVVAAGLAAALGAHYWKPIQAGTADGTDSGRAAALGVPRDHVLREGYRLTLPASPHLAFREEGLEADLARLALPEPRPLIVEGAGGLMVPIRRDPPWMMIDQFARWQAPVLLVTRTALGTINHSLLSVEALRARAIPVAGLLFVGEAHAENESVIPALAGVPHVGRLPLLDPLDARTLAGAIAAHVDLPHLRAAMDSAA